MIKFQKKIKLRNFVFEVTPKCNHDCIYCYNFWRYREYRGRIISLSEWEEIISKLKEETKINLVSISGGEPLLWKHTLELVKMLREHDIKVNLLTNGSLLTKSKAKKFAGAGIGLFEIPLLSHKKEIFEYLTGSKNFEDVLKGIVNASETGASVICVFVATKYNIRDALNVAELSVVLGAKGLMFNRINPAIEEHISLMPSPEALENALSVLNTFSSKYSFPVVSSIPIQPCIIDMSKFPHISHGFCPSVGEDSYFTVDFFGNVRVCNHSSYVLGNLLDRNFTEIFQHPYVKKFADAVPELCRNCKLSRKCFGGCKAAAEACFGSLSAEDPFLKITNPSFERGGG